MSHIKDFQIVLAALPPGAQHYGSSTRIHTWSAQYQYNVTGWNIMPCVWGIIFKGGSVLKWTIELPATFGHHCDMTERLLKVM